MDLSFLSARKSVPYSMRSLCFILFSGCGPALFDLYIRNGATDEMLMSTILTSISKLI